MSILFLPGLPRLTSFLHVLAGLTRATHPKVSAHLEACGVQPSMWGTQWLMTVYAYSFPLHSAVRVWDSFLKEGWKVPLRVALALLGAYSKELLACKGMEEAMHLFKRIPGEDLAREPWRLLKGGFAIRNFAWKKCAELLAEEAWLRERGREGEVGGFTAGTLFATIPHKERTRLMENLPEAPGEEKESEGEGGEE